MSYNHASALDSKVQEMFEQSIRGPEVVLRLRLGGALVFLASAPVPRGDLSAVRTINDAKRKVAAEGTPEAWQRLVAAFRGIPGSTITRTLLSRAGAG